MMLRIAGMALECDKAMMQLPPEYMLIPLLLHQAS